MNEQTLDHFRSVFDSSPDLVAIISQKSRKFLMLNPEMCKLLGYSELDIVESDICEFIDHDDKYAMEAAVQRGRFSRLQIRTVDRDGIPRVLEWSGNQTDSGCLMLVARDVTDDEVAKQELRRLAHFDPVTGLPNRYLFEDRVQQGLAQSARENRLSGLVYIDLDDFKPINDNYGHETGDFVLRTVSTRLKSVIRDTDTVSRIGGDEFCVFLPMLRDEQLVELITGRLSASVSKEIHPPGYEDSVFVGASCGVALFDRDGTDLDSLMRVADRRMYEAKSKKKDRLRAR